MLEQFIEAVLFNTSSAAMLALAAVIADRLLRRPERSPKREW